MLERHTDAEPSAAAGVVPEADLEIVCALARDPAAAQDPSATEAPTANAVLPAARARSRKRSSLEAIQLLTAVGQALSAEKDPGRLMELILDSAKELTRADGGTLYSRTADDRLEFEIMMTDSLGLHLGGSSGRPVTLPPLPLFDANGAANERMVAARAAISGETVNIPDAYDAEGFDFSGTRDFDQRTGYRSTSFLTVPMRNHEDEVER